MSPVLEVRLERERFAPGEAVAGAVVVVEGGSSRSLSVSVVYREWTPDYTHDWVKLPGGVLHQGDLVAGASHPFSVQLPSPAVPGCAGPSCGVAWFVEAGSDELGLDTHERQEFEVEAGPGAGDALAAMLQAVSGAAPGAVAGAAPAAAAATLAPAAPGVTAAGAAPPANWYPDPSGQARLRWWDGARWTEHTAP